MSGLQDSILYIDDDLLVLNKPGGIAVHRGKGTTDDLESHFPELGLEPLPRLAHRLDMDTSGCLVLGRSDEAMTLLGRAFARCKVAKTYWAIVHGAPLGTEGVLSQPLRKLAGPEGGRMRAVADGPAAITHWRLLQSLEGGLSWLELKPETGRTHQLRAHCAHLGCPILGDRLYGPPGDRPPLFLHARHIELWIRKEPLDVEAPLPGYWYSSLRLIGL